MTEQLDRPATHLEERHVRCNQRREVLRVALLCRDIRDDFLAALDSRRAIVRVGREVSVRGEACLGHEAIQNRVLGNVIDLSGDGRKRSQKRSQTESTRAVAVM